MLDDELRNIITENRQAALQDELFLRELKFAFSSGPVDELLARCDVPAKELRFGRRSLLYLRPAVGDPLRVSGQLLRHHRGRARMTYSSIAMARPFAACDSAESVLLFA